MHMRMYVLQKSESKTFRNVGSGGRYFKSKSFYFRSSCDGGGGKKAAKDRLKKNQKHGENIHRDNKRTE